MFPSTTFQTAALSFLDSFSRQPTLCRTSLRFFDMYGINW
jgi:hypothetical protein